jgi:hypothetical protein
MLTFIIKPSVTHVDCFTKLPYVHELADIDYANKFYPEWWTKLPISQENKGFLEPKTTMRGCRGFIDYYKNSLIIPMWSELMIESNKDKYRWKFSDNTPITTHSPEQKQGFMDRNMVLKLATPWLFVQKEYMNWSFKQPFYNFSDPNELIFFPGVVDFKYQFGTNINIGIKYSEEPKSYKINFKQPMVLLTPHTEKKMKFKSHLLDEKEYYKIEQKLGSVSFINRYLNIKRSIDEKEKKSKCPFNFLR